MLDRPPSFGRMLEFMLALGAFIVAGRWLAMAAAALGIPPVVVAMLGARL